MSDTKVYPVPADIARNAHIDADTYRSMYKRSLDDPDNFWAEQAERLTWFKRWDTVNNSDLTKGEIRWFDGGRINAAYNCVDRHLETRGDQTAIIWEPDDPKDAAQNITYKDLHERVSRFANALKERGVKRGDRVCIYLPMVPEAAVAMLACARIGAIHSVVFGGFSPQALRDRIQDSDCQVVVTADESVRGGRSFPLKANADEALKECPSVNTVVVVQRTGNKVDWDDSRDV